MNKDITKVLKQIKEVKKPWGKYEVLFSSNEVVVKRLTVNPGHRMSMQYHEQRDELQIHQSGEGYITLGLEEGPDAEEIDMYCNGCIQIERGRKHRIGCYESSEQPLVLIEIWTGQSLSESDIIRLADDYGRIDEDIK